MLQKILIASIFAGAMVTAATANAKTLSTYDEITSSLIKGKVVLLNFTPTNCTITPEPPKEERNDRLVVKFTDLVEHHNKFNGGKSMRLIANSESGLFGDQRFIFYRSITMVYEDGTVIVVDDGVDPATYKLEERSVMTCKLSADGSGGVTALIQDS